jgi:UDP-glucose 4-epimerase
MVMRSLARRRVLGAARLEQWLRRPSRLWIAYHSPMPPTPLRTLVTGGAGFIGSHLAARLRTLGHDVRVVDNLSTGFRSNLEAIGDDLDFICGDLRDPDVCARAVEGVEVVFHLAALASVPRSFKEPIACHEHNVTATLNLLEACRAQGVRRVVYSSSSSVYGDTPVLPKVESSEPLPRSPYATAKLAGEQYVLAYARGGFVEGVALRYFNVFGPRQDPDGPYAAIIPLVLRAARDGIEVPLYGDGRQTRDFTYVDNVVEANLLAATQPAARVNGWVVNCGAGERTSLLELIALAERVSGRPVRISPRPPREGDVRDSLASLERAHQVLGYEPLVALRDGHVRTWDWMASEASVPTAV